MPVKVIQVSRLYGHF